LTILGEATVNATGKPQFERLWPTLFSSVSLPGAQSANPVLRALFLEKDSSSDDLTVQYLNQDLFGLSHPAVQWLRQCCLQAVFDYATEAGLDYRPEVDLQAWVNINRRGDYHNLHNHPHSWLSGTYYVDVPSPSVEVGQRTDLNPCEISFFDPRAQANMTAVRGDGQFDPEYRRLPKSGELFVWPSFIHHFVHPNLGDTPRISVSFNAVLRRKVF
jgi:uncharacterized protein (TIGR02466 family)